MDFDALHPFSSFNSDPNYNGKFNGATGWIMQSSVDKETLEDAFKQAIDEGFDINDERIQNMIFEQTKCRADSLTPVDYETLVKHIEKYYNENQKSLF